MDVSNSVALEVPPAQQFIAMLKGVVEEGTSGFIRKHWFATVPISLLLLVPCFWHRWLEAGDLGSHVYNAWLTQMIERGDARGLWLVRQSNNVLFDLLLSGLGRIFSLTVAYRFAAALAVLVFFWGVFTFVRAASRRTPWFLTPIIGVIAYGWTFNEGVFNYYLSLGLAFLALSIWWVGKSWKRCAALVFAPFILLAHPMGLAWALGAGLYVAIAEITPRRLHPLLVFGAVGSLGIATAFLRQRYSTAAPAHSAFFYSGLDQLLFTRRYEIAVVMFCAILAIAFAREVLSLGAPSDLFGRCAIPLGLYLVVEAGIQLLPDSVRLPQYAAPVGSLTGRLTLISAVLLCCLLGAVTPRTWHLFALGTVAAIFFAFLYQDTGTLSNMQERVYSLVRALPPGQRIVSTIRPPLRYRFSPKHILDLACVGYCFSYGNYEAATKQFRVRASPENVVVMSDMRDTSSAEAGTYVVRARELPLYQVYQCHTWIDVCLRPLQAGETDGQFGIDPK